jgi:hypothetical protein
MQAAEGSDAEQPPVVAAPQYFSPTPLKFIAMSVCTFGLYELYWSYKNWRFVKDRDDLDIMPLGRAFFYPLWHYALLTQLNTTLRSKVLSIWLFRAALAAILIALNITIRLPDPYWLVSTLTFVAFIPAILAMQSRSRSFHPSNLIAYLLGGPLFLLVVLSAIGFLPSTMVITHDQLWDRDIAYLRDNEILGPDEKIAYFYSEGIWSIAEGGQFFSDQFVTSYSRDVDTGETYLDYVEFSRISDIDVVWSESWLDVTIVTITTDEDYQFTLWLSAEEGGDRMFVNQMNNVWYLSRN